MDRFKTVVEKYIMPPKPELQFSSDELVEQGDFFIDRQDSHLHIAYRHFTDKRWVLIDLHNGQEVGGNTSDDRPRLRDITVGHDRFIKV